VSTVPGFGEGTRQFVQNFTLKHVSTMEHWIQLEAKNEVNQILQGFFEGLDG
jgi:soluble epoxide hydrolase / lipid-phosphate phosphatase